MKSLLLIPLLFLGACSTTYPQQDGGYVVPYQKYYNATSDSKPIPGIHKSKSLQEVNTRVNHYVKYVFDPKNHWQSPQETIAKGTGECIDYALLKRQIVIQLGLAAPKDTYIILIYDRKVKMEHAVLMVNHMILDSQINKLYNIGSKTFRSRYTMQVVVKQ